MIFMNGLLLKVQPMIMLGPGKFKTGFLQFYSLPPGGARKEGLKLTGPSPDPELNIPSSAGKMVAAYKSLYISIATYPVVEQGRTVGLENLCTHEHDPKLRENPNPADIYFFTNFGTYSCKCLSCCCMHDFYEWSAPQSSAYDNARAGEV